MVKENPTAVCSSVISELCLIESVSLFKDNITSDLVLFARVTKLQPNY
jgi:hypothetical protein